jgi:hypothetical protein
LQQQQQQLRKKLGPLRQDPGTLVNRIINHVVDGHFPKHGIHRCPFDILFWLVVSNMFYFPFHIWDVILPIDYFFQDGYCTTNQIMINHY